MFRLEYTSFLYALSLIPLLILLFGVMWYWKKRALQKLGERRLILQLIPAMPRHKPQLKLALLLLALLFLIIGLANPQIGTKMEKVKREGVDLVIAIDVSRSMLAEDVKPNRLKRARQYVSRLLGQLKQDRVAMIVFAGNAYLQLPLTIDYAAAKMFLSTIDTDMVPAQGTAIGEAIALAMQTFEAGEQQHKALVLITDGENHEEDAMALAEQAGKEGVLIYTVGVGSGKGAPIPIYRNGAQVDFKRDREDNIVLSRLNEKMLQQLAAAGNGEYHRLSGGTDNVEALVEAIAGMEKKELEERVFTDYDDKFQYFLAIALFFLTLEFFISDRRSRWWTENKLFKPGKQTRA